MKMEGATRNEKGRVCRSRDPGSVKDVGVGKTKESIVLVIDLKKKIKKLNKSHRQRGCYYF